MSCGHLGNWMRHFECIQINSANPREDRVEMYEKDNGVDSDHADNSDNGVTTSAF